MTSEEDLYTPAATKAKSRQRFRTIAGGLAAKIEGGPTAPSQGAGGRVSEAFALFDDKKTLLIAVGLDEGQLLVDLALAHGLHHAKDKDLLLLLLPTDKAKPTQIRAAWLNKPIKIFGYTDYEGAPIPLEPARLEPGGCVSEVEPNLGRFPWVNALVKELEGYVDPEKLVPAHRHSYLTWHYRGRQVLRTSSPTDASKDVKVIAGVNYSKPEPNQLPPVSVTITEEPSSEMRDLLRAAVIMAIKNRRDGIDAGHQEHQLQESLSYRGGELGFTQMEREFPVRRPGEEPSDETPAREARAFIDFLVRHEDGSLHVVETKIGPDPMLVLQGLDYWLWVKANMDDLRGRFKLPPETEVKIDFVVAEKKGLVSRYTLDQLAALKDEIAWRFHIVKNWESGETLEIKSLDWNQPPPSTGV